ncbi:MAG: sugar porter family MFS transporter [Brevinema sp.]
MKNIYIISFYAALGGLLFGYDTGVIAGAIGYLREYFNLNAYQVGLAVSSALIGCAVGALVSGTVAGKLGRKKAMILAGIAYTISAVGSAFPGNFTGFVIYRIIGGLSIGISSVVPLYIAEIAPSEKRGSLNTFFQLCITFGILVSFFCNYFIASGKESVWLLNSGWRWMFGLEAFPAIFFTIVLNFIPESPRWLITRGRNQEAKQILQNIQGETAGNDSYEEILNSYHSEQSQQTTVVKWSKAGKRALFIAVSLAVLQQTTGINVIIYYANTLIASISSGTPEAVFQQTILLGIVNFGVTFVATYFLDRWGRRSMMYWGSLSLTVILFIMGAALMMRQTGTGLLVILFTYIIIFGSSVGPIVWMLIPEISPNLERNKIVAIATGSLWVANIIVSQTFPILHENPTLQASFNGGFSFFVYGILTAVMFYIIKKYLPETKNKSLEQIEKDILSKI